MYSATLLTNRGYLVSLGNMFASGVLLAAAFVHTIPDAVTILSPLSNYPFSGLTVGATFIFLLIIEELVHIYTHDDDGMHAHEPLLKSGTQTTPERHDNVNCGHDHGHGHGHGQSRHGYNSIPNSPLPNRNGNNHSTISVASATPQHNIQPSTHTHQSHVQQHIQASTVASIMLFVTLDVHSLFAGMSVGVKLGDISLLVALGIHKLTAGFALGSTFAKVQLSKSRFFMCCLFFSLMAPTGVLVGAMIKEEDPTNTMMFGVIYSIVGGTFLYIGILELGFKELLICRDDPHGSGVHIDREKGKLVALVIGFSLMAVLALWL